MPVYVDDMQADFKGYVMCHMIADSTEELFAMADIIGAAHKYIQNPGTLKEHFDFPLERREIAVAHGAVKSRGARRLLSYGQKGR